MTDHDPEIHRRLLESLTDGVMVIGHDGSFRMANAAAYRMFGLDPEETVGRSFGEVFVVFEGFDAFTEIVLDAVFERRDTAHRVARVPVGGHLRSLSVTVSRLAPGDASRSGTEAVIVLVSDITEVRELRETELRQAGVIKAQLNEIQAAYRDLEARNAELSAMTRRVHRTRLGAVLFVLLLFLAIGSFYLAPLDVSSPTIAIAMDADQDIGETGALPTLTVTPRELRSIIALRGRLVPGRVVEVVSPIESHVGAMHAFPGDRVTKGDLLVELDTGRLAEERSRAQIELIRARDRLAEIENWENGADMARARRALRRARIALDEAEQHLRRTAFLLDEGLVPASEREAAERQRESRALDVEEAERELEAVAAKGGAEARRIAFLEARAAEDRVRDHEAKLDLSQVRAPVSGVVIAPGGTKQGALTKGRAVAQGELMLGISDSERLSVVTQVDEVDVGKVGTGQMAWISGPGFPGMKIDGTVTRVSSRAENASRRNAAPQFEVVVALDGLDAEALDRLRVGMSAHVTILVRHRPEALLVPIDAVERWDGGSWLRVLSETDGHAERRMVELGVTTLDSVEVLEGISAGDRIVLDR
ncbi:MAG: efflux RND transporter periplasmic adaptor subunit [Boseongicola sp.]|nr:efflux RND transporter periplasmic adaptor subunit [Boseongicola sp.]